MRIITVVTNILTDVLWFIYLLQQFETSRYILILVMWRSHQTLVNWVVAAPTSSVVNHNSKRYYRGHHLASPDGSTLRNLILAVNNNDLIFVQVICLLSSEKRKLQILTRPRITFLSLSITLHITNSAYRLNIKGICAYLMLSLVCVFVKK